MRCRLPSTATSDRYRGWIAGFGPGSLSGHDLPSRVGHWVRIGDDEGMVRELLISTEPGRLEPRK